VKCLHDFDDQVVCALKELHCKLHRAHLDVRIPNICFTRNGDVRLIDLDRTRPDNAPIDNYKDSFFYELPENQSTMDMDWRQLGLPIYYALHGTEIQKESSTSRKHHLDELRKTPFLSSLVNFKMDSEQFAQWKNNLPVCSKCSVRDVLSEVFQNGVHS